MWLTGPSYNYILCPSCAHSYSHLGYFPVELLQCTLPGSTLEEFPKISAVIKCSSVRSYKFLGRKHIVSLFLELHWLPVYFQDQFNMLKMIFRILHGIGPDYLRDHLFSILSAYPTRSSKVSVLQIPLARERHLATIGVG